MEKHKGYQKILEDGEIKTKNSMFYRISKRFKFLERKYWELSRIGLYGIKDIPNIKTAQNIVEIGCGSGSALSYIKHFFNKEAKFYGIDLDKNSFLPEWVNFFNADIDNDLLPLPDNSVDTVISIFVLEHLHNPQNLIKEAYRILRNGGTLYLVTENYSSVFIPFHRFNFYQDFTHIRPWTKTSLTNIVKVYGFNDISVGIIRPKEYFLLLPFMPILGAFNTENFFLMFRFIFGSSLFLRAKKINKK